mgnify:CR=1 FL=1
MKEIGAKQNGLSKQAVIILVIFAIVLVTFAIVSSYSNVDKKVPTTQSSLGSGNPVDSSGGKVGIVVVPNQIEDKGTK